ncbi:hypothetical protein [Streptomyces sp. NPDC059787]|uniref:hypothetical protein n=1 Tax=Streptomyces sp. NPDC059787 TaxID=3346947 RepID=UPI003652A7A4
MPWVVTDGTGAFLDFVAQAFDGEELGRVATEDGAIGHGEIRVGDTVVRDPVYAEGMRVAQATLDAGLTGRSSTPVRTAG